MTAPAPTAPTKKKRASAHGAKRPAGRGFELWTWWFMRVSGLILVFLVLGHFAIVHLIDTGVDRVNFAFVSGRWSSPFWQTYDGMLLTLGLMHGANGMRVIIEDYVRPQRRALVKNALYIVSFLMFVLGLLIIVTFDPGRGSAILGK